MKKERVSRREFLKRSGGGSVALTAVAPALGLGRNGLSGSAQESASLDRHAIFAALGDTLIPTDLDDPGYKSLERYKITEEVMKGLGSISDADLDAFNKASAAFFFGQRFSPPDRIATRRLSAAYYRWEKGWR